MPSVIQLATRFFGALECSEESTITFPSGIPPFADQKFVVISSEDTPVVFLQSATTPELCFLTVPMQTLDPEYRVQMERFDREALQLDVEPGTAEQLTCLAILTIPERGSPTANLAAPVVINPTRNIGVQAVRSDRAYSHAHPVEPVTAGGEKC